MNSGFRPTQLLAAAVELFTLFTICGILVIDVPFGIPDKNRCTFRADALMARLAFAVTALGAVLGG